MAKGVLIFKVGIGGRAVGVALTFLLTAAVVTLTEEGGVVVLKVVVTTAVLAAVVVKADMLPVFVGKAVLTFADKTEVSVVFAAAVVNEAVLTLI